MTNPALSNMLHEERRFEPPEELARNANVKAEAYARAESDRLAFWEEQADRLTLGNALEGRPGLVRGAVREVVHRRPAQRRVQLPRSARRGRPRRQGRVPLRGRAGRHPEITYAELTDLVCQTANTLTDLGVKTGDRVAIYMPMIPETVVAMLACARIGAPHTVVFGGFSADALKTRIHDCDARLVITSDGGYRRGNPSSLKPAVDEALKECPDVRNVLVVRRTGQDVEWTDGRDVWWHDTVEKASTEHTPEAFDSEHPLYVMYTSGTTGKPKGILHTTGGYLTECSYTHWAVFDLKADDDIFWTRGRHRLGDRPQLHRLRAARQRRYLGDVRGDTRHPAQGPLVGDHRASTRSRSSTARRRRSARS